MSSYDLYEDGFPHGTKEGYDRGCRGAACPGALEDGGMTCSQAKTRYNGDYGYRKRVDAGMTPAQIRAEEPPKPASPKPVARQKPPTPTPVAADLQQWPNDKVEHEPTRPSEEPAPGAEYVDPKTGKPIPLEEHGTHKGYWHGCRDITCPGVKLVGKSCRRAINDYQAEKKRARLAVSKDVAEQTEPELEPVTQVEPMAAPVGAVAEPEPHTELKGEPEPSALDVAHAEIARLTDELAQLRALLAEPLAAEPEEISEAAVERSQVTLADGLTVTIAVTVGRAA